MLRVLIIIFAVVLGVVLGGLVGFFLPLLFFVSLDAVAGGSASAGWVIAIITIPLCAIGGGLWSGIVAARKTKSLNMSNTL